jgi:hypothetical protein
MRMKERDVREVECGKCGIIDDEFFMKKVDVFDGLDEDGEELSTEIYLCQHCAEPPED